MRRGRWEIKCATREENQLQEDGTYKLERVDYFWWRYVAANGEAVCVSEMYTTEAAARKGISAVKRGVLNPVVFRP